MEQNSPIHARQGDDMERDTSPRVDLEPLANASRLRRRDEAIKEQEKQLQASE